MSAVTMMDGAPRSVSRNKAQSGRTSPPVSMSGQVCSSQAMLITTGVVARAKRARGQDMYQYVRVMCRLRVAAARILHHRVVERQVDPA